MDVLTTARLDALRAELDALSWPDRFERLAALEKRSSQEMRSAIAELRATLAMAALEELSTAWGGMPLKEGVLRLSSKCMRGALTRAAKAVRDRAIIEIMRSGSAPLGSAGGRFGVGFDERVVEMPLALRTARLDEPGRVLDAGSALNVPVVRELVRCPVAWVTHFTLPGSKEPKPALGTDRVRHEEGDLRAMPYADATFDRVVCISTLEHVGLDTTRFGASADAVGDPESATRALAELLRVLKGGGELLLSVPYGRAAEHGWFRIFDAPALARLLVPARGCSVEQRFFYYDAGWNEGGPVPPPSTTDTGFAPDVVTGVAVVSIRKEAC